MSSSHTGEGGEALCAFHLLFGRQVVLDDDGRCGRCADAPVDAPVAPRRWDEEQ